MKFICTFITIMTFLQSSHAGTQVVTQGEPNNQRSLIFTQVSPGQHSFEFMQTSYALEVTHKNGITMELICRGVGLKPINTGGFDNDIEEVQHSLLIYKNIANIEVGKFYFSDHRLCDKVGHHLQATFEFISPDYPLEIEIDIPNNRITKVILPKIDPYLERIPDEEKRVEPAPQSPANSDKTLPKTKLATVIHKKGP